MSAIDFSLGVIEGFYGHPWSWDARASYIDFLKTHHFKFYIYAPKSDLYLRQQWREPWSEDDFCKLKQLSDQYQTQGLDFGIALSPFELYKNWNREAQLQLHEKVQQLNQLSPTILCVLFDDMRGDLPDLAKLQVEICHQIAADSTAKKIIICPTYYSHEPILNELFGQRPKKYWQDLAINLDASIEIFWTGDKVCSAAYTVESIEQMNEIFKRKISLWDNYPVNDGRLTSEYLHIEAFQGRPAELSNYLQRHAVNPMNAAFLSHIPLLTLADAYSQGVGYNAQASQSMALLDICGAALAAQIAKDINVFQRQGLTALSQVQRQDLLTIYRNYSHPCAREICLWLEAYYQFDPACLTG